MNDIVIAGDDPAGFIDRKADAERALNSPTDWRSALIVGRGDKPRPLLANAITALRHAPEWRGVIWHDAFHNIPVARGKLPFITDSSHSGDVAWSDRFDALTACWLQQHGIAASADLTGRAVVTVALEHVFHPVLDYLEKCRWDGKPRLDLWPVTYLGAPDSPYCRAVGSRWFISAVARVYAPGCKADCALILEGPQGTLKSSALRILAAPWFTDEIADLGTKDAAMQLAGAWIVELAELDSMARGDVSRIKAFMSRSVDRYRPPYGRHVVAQPRQCVFAGTVNHNEYLRDETGGRRFWPVECTKIAIDELTEDRAQLWGEALARYHAGEKWWLDGRALTEAAETEQAARYQSDVWEPRIKEFISGCATVSVPEILMHALLLPIEKWGQPEQNRIARCLRAMGWQRFQFRRSGGEREWRYRPSPLSPVKE